MIYLDYYFHAWPLEAVMPEEETSPDPVFIFRFNVISIHSPLQIMVDEDDDDNNDFVPQLENSQSETIEETFQVLRERILQESTSGSAISDMLCAVRVPLEIQDPNMVHTISACAREAVRQAQMAGHRALEVWVTINVWQNVYEESWISNYSQISEHAMEEDYVIGLQARTAPKSSSIEGIADQQCAICLEDLSTGASEATRMPCLHLFHGSCIGKWLERSLFCPLCRFQLPGSR